MRYFGIPVCPYCKKRVNLIRTWSLKKQGEYRCPRCGGISNVFLSPLIYIFAVLAIFSSVALFFFHRFMLDDVSLKTVVQVFIPFAAFFFLSLFMVYLAKPVIKRAVRRDNGRKRESRRDDYYEDEYFREGENYREYYEDDDYYEDGDYYEDDTDMKIYTPGHSRSDSREQRRGTRYRN